MKYLSKLSSKKIAFVMAIVAVLMMAFAPTAIVTAQSDDIFGGQEKNAPSQFVETSTEDIGALIISILEILLSIVGLIAVVFLVWGGFKYMTASGDEERVSGAKSTIINALIGLVIVLLAFAIVRVVDNLLRDTAEGAFMLLDLYV